MTALQRIQSCPCNQFLIERAITFFFLLLFIFCSHALVSPRSRNVTTDDELALLSFKSMISVGSSEGSLASWNTSSGYCNWPGVICGGRWHPERVVALQLSSSNLSGHISPFLGNLSFLKKLELGNNHLVGQIPPEVRHLIKLQVLDLRSNYLQGSIPVALAECTNLTKLVLSHNQLRGEIPMKLSALKNLETLDIQDNGFSGQIPRSLADLPAIKFLFFSRNRLSGEIPPGLGNHSNLSALTLDNNMLSGAIPSSLGSSSLYWINLSNNNLSGVIPASIWNISSLSNFSVQHNMLSGTIPPNGFSNLVHLRRIYMDANQFHGRIPASIANASNLSVLQLLSNFFSGTVPPEVGRLRSLRWLQISGNLLYAKESKDWEFITTLQNCSSLEALGLGLNKFEGVLPDSLANLSISLVSVILAGNKISGSIPKDIGNLINLQNLILFENSFTGTLPSSLSQLRNLRRLQVDRNKISGSIPWTIGNLTELTSLNLSMNAFSGWLPSSLGNLTKLLELNLANNNFIGTIPIGLFNIVTLSKVLDLSHNKLEGSIPPQIGKLKNLAVFRAESNKFSGEIPSTIGKCQLLQYLVLQNNFLNGSISVLSQLKGLEALYLSRNNFSGPIPKSFGDLTSLHYLDLSFNSFAGEVPSVGIFANSTAISIQGNRMLCGGILDLHLPPCSSQLEKNNHKFPLVPVLCSLIAALFVLVLLYKLLTCHKKVQEKNSSAMSVQGHLLVSYAQLVKATNGFSKTNFLGSGSFGSVYKGKLEGHAGERTTDLVAVKVLKLHTPKAHESFMSECEALQTVRHRNLIKIITVCSSIDTRGNDFKAIVYEFMPNGSLESWLHPDTNEEVEKHLNLHQRVAILLDVAYALDYLHWHGAAPIAHCDVKSSNVLLDANMVAHLGDFGLARILVDGDSFFQDSTSSIVLRGTIGYAAPEYGAGNMVSTNGDVYSYGILILETVSGKRPTDGGLRQGLISLREYVELSLCDRVTNIVDTQLSLDLENGLQTGNDSSYKRKLDCLVSLFRLGMSCSQEVPSSRTPTRDIIKELHAIKESLEGIQNM
ncbi:unnamed protein product [Urochloa decumbens]|uniref:Receptor kinase-like protein Xa21 n=1 Tax=Urochloa decumbens TaxID=240449 RepID=A0ABC9AQI3_9POAL